MNGRPLDPRQSCQAGYRVPVIGGTYFRQRSPGTALAGLTASLLPISLGLPAMLCTVQATGLPQPNAPPTSSILQPLPPLSSSAWQAAPNLTQEGESIH